MPRPRNVERRRVETEPKTIPNICTLCSVLIYQNDLSKTASDQSFLHAKTVSFFAIILCIPPCISDNFDKYFLYTRTFRKAKECDFF